MDIPVIAIPLDRIYKLSADQQQDPEPMKNWRETVILPKVFSTLELYFMREGIENIDSLRNVCHALTDPSLALMFTPVNHQRRHLTLAEVHKRINVVRALETDVSDEAHCALGVCFVGLAGREFSRLMRSIQSQSGNLAYSDTSVKSTRSSVETLTVGHPSTAVAWRPNDSPVSLAPDVRPAPVSADVTPSSVDAALPVDRPTRDSNNPLSSHGLQNVFAETVLSGSDEEDEEIEFSYGTGPSPRSLPPSTSPRGFPGDALVSPLSRRQFGFTRDFLRDAGAHFKTRVTKLWDTSPRVGFMSTPHRPSTFLPSRTVVQVDGGPPLTPVPEISSASEAPSPARDPDVSLRPSSWTLPCAGDVPRSILRRSPAGIPPADVHGNPTPPSGVNRRSDSPAVSPSDQDVRARASSTRRDPPWDSHDRDGFRSSHTYDQLVEARDRRPYAFGASWTFWHENPQDPNFRVDPRTGTVPPWRAHRVDYGMVLCHPVSVMWRFQDKELFLSCFRFRQFNVDQRKQIFRAVPPFAENHNFLLWYSRFVSVMMGFGLYVPPAQTMRDGDPLGIWFKDLPIHVQVDVENVFGDVLASLLRYKSTGLLTDPALSQIIHQHDNGYEAIYDLLVHAGHPFLQAFPSLPTEPRQHTDCKLSDYCLDWAVYTLHRALHGEYLSDRYFMQQFLSNMHRSLQAHVREWLEQAVTNTYVHDPLSHTFSPDRLFTKILARVRHLGHEKLALESPRDSSRSTHLVRALTLPAPDDDDDLLVAAVASSTARPCFLCASDHLLISCPLLADIQKDSFRRKALLRALGATAPSSAPAGGSKQVRAVLDASLSDSALPVASSDDAPGVAAAASDF